MSTTGHGHCLLIAYDFVMIAKCLESFTSSFKGFGFVRYNQNWCASSSVQQIPPGRIPQSHVSVLEKSICWVFWTLNSLFICFSYGYGYIILEMMWITFSSQTWQNYARYCLQATSKDWKGWASIKSKTFDILIFFKLDSRHCLKYLTWSDDIILTILFIVSVSSWLDDTINWTFHFDPKFGQDYLSP